MTSETSLKKMIPVVLLGRQSFFCRELMASVNASWSNLSLNGPDRASSPVPARASWLITERFTLRRTSSSGHFHIQPDKSFILVWISLNAPSCFLSWLGEFYQAVSWSTYCPPGGPVWGVRPVNGYLLKQHGVEGKVTAFAWSLHPSSEPQGHLSSPHAHRAAGMGPQMLEPPGRGFNKSAGLSPVGGVTALILSDP